MTSKYRTNISIECLCCAQACLTLCSPIDCSLSGSSVHGIFQARILEQVAISFCRGYSQFREQACVSCASCIDRQFLYHCKLINEIKTKQNQPFYLCCDLKHFSRITENFRSIKACKHGVYFPQEPKNLLIFTSVLNCKLNKATHKEVAKVTAWRFCKTHPYCWGR